LYEIIKDNPSNIKAANQLALVPSAKICTIDSFCINLVRENFFKLDISQDFSILDNSQQKIIEQNAVDEVVENHYQNGSQEFKEVVELFSTTKNDDNLISEIKQISLYISAQAFPYDWLSDVCEIYNPEIPIDESEVKDYVFSEIEYCVSYIIGVIDDLLIALSPDDELFDKYRAVLEEDLSIAQKIEGCLNSSWDEMKNALDCTSFRSTPYKRNYESPLKTTLSSRRKQYKELIEGLRIMMSPSAEDFRKDNEFLYPKLKYLCEIVREYNEKMLEIKKEMNAYSFSDIEHFAIDLLFYKEGGEIKRTDLERELEESFFEILVDEYQDTNAAQDTLFEMLSNGRNRFMVGDIKQSIYRFRLAMPALFNSKKETFDDYKNSDSINRKIILDRNFRSNSGICDFTNFLFSNLMSKRIGEVDYNSEEYLNCGRNDEQPDIPSAQLHIVDVPEDEDVDEYEARKIAKLILDKIAAKEQIKDGDSIRNIRFSDFAILFRYPKNRVETYTKVFSEYSIPYTADNKTNIFENNEISVLVSLLRVIDNPSRDVPLLATLMSVFYGYSAEQIARVRADNKKENLYSSICRDKETFGAFIESIDNYRKLASSMSIESFLRQLISSTSYLSLISAMGNAEQRKLNVMKLIDIAHNFDGGENVGITAFMRYLDSVIESGINVDSASVVHGKENSVSIMSVHQSKGLEFPICIFASTAHKYNKSDLSDLVLMNFEKGIGLKVNDEEQLVRYNSLQYSVIKNMNACALMSENLRLLYVAVTRAKEQFISFVSLKGAENHINSLSNNIVGGYISPIVVKKIQNDGDLLLLTALIHRDGAKLRSLCDAKIDFDTDFSFDYKIDISGDVESANSEETEKALPDEKTVEELREKLSFRYERSALSSFASKRSASELDNRERGYAFFAKSKPAFLLKDELTPAQKGTAMHTFMQHCDYDLAKENLENEIERLVDSAQLTEIQAKSLSREKLRSFFESDFAERMFRSDRIYREIRVSSFVKASELENTSFDDVILVQGIADCDFEENGKLALV
ncbi:MAG: UvrD-helicase domain-containing protein, partial [Eubacterium sp.]|nr:UvrD-helicase domain-containing protein [Eubacterium sp.]